MLLDLLSQIEPDDSWRPVYPNPQPPPYPRAAYAASFYVANLDIALTHPPGPSGILTAGRTRQYLPMVAPLFTGAVVTVTLDWLGELPPLPRSLPRADGWNAFVQAPAATPDRSWAPTFPDRLSLPIARAAYQPGTIALVVDTTTGQALAGGARLWAGRLYQYQGVAGPLFVETPTAVSLDWYPSLPPLRFLQQRADGWYVFVPLQPSPDLAWHPTFPDRLSTLPQPVRQSFAFEPFPRPPADYLTAFAFFPDRLNRVTLPPALMPSFFYGTWVPIPNPPTTLVLEDRVLIGQNQSIETPFYPSIGGSTTWT